MQLQARACETPKAVNCLRAATRSECDIPGTAWSARKTLDAVIGSGSKRVETSADLASVKESNGTISPCAQGGSQCRYLTSAFQVNELWRRTWQASSSSSRKNPCMICMNERGVTRLLVLTTRLWFAWGLDGVRGCSDTTIASSTGG
jgi:hypothetical protein